MPAAFVKVKRQRIKLIEEQAELLTNNFVYFLFVGQSILAKLRRFVFFLDMTRYHFDFLGSNPRYFFTMSQNKCHNNCPEKKNRHPP